MAIHKGKIRQKKEDGTYDYLLPETLSSLVQDEVNNQLLSETLEDINDSLMSLESQISQYQPSISSQSYKITTFTEQGVAFDTSEDNHASWLHTNVSYDESDDSFFVVYNTQPTHSITQSKVYARKKPRNGNFGSKITIASRLGSNISAKCQSSGIAKNGDYLAVIAHINPSTQAILGTFLYRSTNKGLTWNTGTEIKINGNSLIAYSGDVSGFRTLSNGRILLWGWYQNKQSFSIYSDDNGLTWSFATINGNPTNVTEPTFIELDDGTIIGYARDNVTDGNDHITTPKAAWFLKSLDGGTTWQTPVKSASILDMSNNNCAFIKHRNSNLVEIVYGSRHLQADGFGSIYQAITTQEDLKNDRWQPSVRIARVNGIPASLSGDGDSGYYGAATAVDGTSLVFYYNGTKSLSKIYYLKGNYNAKVYDEITITNNNGSGTGSGGGSVEGLSGIQNPTSGQLILGDFASTKGHLILRRYANSTNAFLDFAVANNGDGFISLMKTVGTTDTNLARITLSPNGSVTIPTLTTTNLTVNSINTNNTPISINQITSKEISLQSTTNRLKLYVDSNHYGRITFNSVGATDTGAGNNYLDFVISKDSLWSQFDNYASLGTTTKRFKNGYFAGVFGLPTYTSGNKPTTSIITGATLFNSTSKRLEVYDGSSWVDTFGKFVSVPSSSTTSGVKGDFSADENYIYVCRDTNTWVRVTKDSTW